MNLLGKTRTDLSPDLSRRWTVGAGGHGTAPDEAHDGQALSVSGANLLLCPRWAAEPCVPLLVGCPVKANQALL